MFGERLRAIDLLFCAALALLITGKVITVEEGIQGFANEGLLTVAALFVVAQGISSTGGLDWYMGRFLGKPKTIASAQILVDDSNRHYIGVFEQHAGGGSHDSYRPAVGGE